MASDRATVRLLSVGEWLHAIPLWLSYRLLRARSAAVSPPHAISIMAAPGRRCAPPLQPFQLDSWL